MLGHIELAVLQCTVAVERLNPAGQAIKWQLIRKATVTLGHNEFQEIVLRVHDDRALQNFMLHDFQLFTRFAKDGKCTLKFIPVNMQVLVSDCPRSASNIRHPKVKVLHPNKKPVLVFPVAQKLSKEQTAVLSEVLSGSAGTGKSFLFKRIIACHIGGTTLIGSGSAPLEQWIELARHPVVLQHWTSCKHLIIDEISMVKSEEFFDKLEAVARSIRRSTELFGGIQLIVCGDFLQLPPVTKGKDKANICFQCIHIMNMELMEERRQTDKGFISLLQAVRVGRVTEEVTAQLLRSANHSIERDGILATRLCTHKDDVELTNENKLKQLGYKHSVRCCDVASFVTTPPFAGLPQVRFLCGAVEVIKRDRQQLPLKLAWAISIQSGMTLDYVEISLARVFESGQAYVALSWARSLEGLRVMDFDP
uniref:ATP-dependent DNA helicase n=1 Tax=Cyprinus carpio TaxID=7962 RepID=A0A8C1ZJZ0_CYPCA